MIEKLCIVEDEDTFQVFSAAIERGNVGLCQTLLKWRPALVNTKFKDTDSPGCAMFIPSLHFAAAKGSLRDGPDSIKTFEAILSVSPGSLEQRSSDGRTPLFYAVRGHATHILELMIAKGVDMWATDDNGRCALHYCRQQPTVDLFLQRGADKHAIDLLGLSLIHI